MAKGHNNFALLHKTCLSFGSPMKKYRVQTQNTPRYLTMHVCLEPDISRTNRSTFTLTAVIDSRESRQKISYLGPCSGDVRNGRTIRVFGILIVFPISSTKCLSLQPRTDATHNPEYGHLTHVLFIQYINYANRKVQKNQQV